MASHPHSTLSPRQLWRALGAVAGGGVVGCVVRDLVLKWQPGAGPSWLGRVPWVLIGVNTLGVYVATWLLRGPLRHHDPNDRLRLFLVTGLLGGLTSYSSLFTDLAAVWHRSVPGAVASGAAALLLGLAAAALGLRGSHR